VTTATNDPTTLTIRYRLRPESVERHLELLRAVHDELAAVRPPGLRWESFRHDDEVTFLDLLRVDRPGQLSRLTAWPAFRGGLDARCDEPPVIAELEPLAAYGPA
jgi:hypothetical protein